MRTEEACLHQLSILQRRQLPADVLRTIYHRCAQRLFPDRPRQFRRRGSLGASKRVPLRGTSRTSVVGQALRVQGGSASPEDDDNRRWRDIRRQIPPPPSTPLGTHLPP